MQIKHVLILSILILPLFTIAPAMAPIVSNAQFTLMQVDSALPAQFAKETLRVAVYAESNTSLPSYATGGVYTSNYQNVINLLNSQGYAATALSTQDILNHKLMAAFYDVFVIPDQLPRENITNLVKEYWLGGGGILSFNSAIGYLMYSGILSPTLEGQFRLYPISPIGLWAYFSQKNSIVEYRNPVSKAFQVDDVLTDITGNLTVFEHNNLPGIVGAPFTSILVNSTDTTNGLVFSVDNPDRGGRVVQLPGDCSTIPNSIRQLTRDAIDWLAPHPKAKILYDLTHMPDYGVDAWDSEYVSLGTLHTNMRDMLVNHSYTFDKLYPSASGNLTTTNLESYDVVIVNDPDFNFTAQEVADFTNWLNSGGSFLAVADHLVAQNQNMNYLLSSTDIALNLTVAGSNSLVPSGIHPTHEGCSDMSCLAPGSVAITGSAFPLWEDLSGIPVIGGDEHGNGRIIVIADGAILRDGRIEMVDNAQFAMNAINWLSTATADILVYTDRDPAMFPDYNFYKSLVAGALNSLGLNFYITNDPYYFNVSLYEKSWKLVIMDNNFYGAASDYFENLRDYLVSGGRLISRSWKLGLPSVLWDYVGVRGNGSSITSGPPTVYLWNQEHPIFNVPHDYQAANISSSNDDFNTDYRYVEPLYNATAIAGITPTMEANDSAIILSNTGRAITNAFSISQYIDDTDDSTYPDGMEIFVNEIGYIYFGRPTINHPDDVSYMETETGNEISWSPTAPAGAWEYVLRVNGTIEESSRWNGGPITINIDGVNASVTEYQLTVFDRLGYSVSDTVNLNVTAYTSTTTTTGGGLTIDPWLLIFIGIGVVGVIIVVVILTRRGKK